jgi:hypothetical protein
MCVCVCVCVCVCEWVWVCVGGARDSVVAWGNLLQAGRLRVRVPMRSLDFFSSCPIPSNRDMALVVDSASNRNEFQESSWG